MQSAADEQLFEVTFIYVRETVEKQR